MSLYHFNIAVNYLSVLIELNFDLIIEFKNEENLHGMCLFFVQDFFFCGQLN